MQCFSWWWRQTGKRWSQVLCRKTVVKPKRFANVHCHYTYFFFFFKSFFIFLQKKTSSRYKTTGSKPAFFNCDIVLISDFFHHFNNVLMVGQVNQIISAAAWCVKSCFTINFLYCFLKDLWHNCNHLSTFCHFDNPIFL